MSGVTIRMTSLELLTEFYPLVVLILAFYKGKHCFDAERSSSSFASYKSLKISLRQPERTISSIAEILCP